VKFIQNGQFALYAEKILSAKDYYKDYLDRKINSAQFREAMYADKSLSEVAGFNNSYNIDRISITPPDDRLPIEKIVNYLVDRNIISAESRDNMYVGFDEYRKYIRENYDHGEFFTCIYPEDERLLYAIAKISRPKKVFVAGSYYGYFAIWGMKTIHENDGMIVLSDVDGEVCELAEENFKKLGYENNVKIYCEDASVLLANRTEPIDMLILDAMGMHDDPIPERRGKRIYGAFLQDAKHLLSKGSVIVIHNMEPEKPEMKPLVDGLQSLNAVGTNYDTYNGVGIYIMI